MYQVALQNRTFLFNHTEFKFRFKKVVEKNIHGLFQNRNILSLLAGKF